MDINDYKKKQTELALIAALKEGEASAQNKECLSVDEAEIRLALNETPHKMV